MKTCERALHTKNYRPVAYLGRGGLGAWSSFGRWKMSHGCILVYPQYRNATYVTTGQAYTYRWYGLLRFTLWLALCVMWYLGRIFHSAAEVTAAACALLVDWVVYRYGGCMWVCRPTCVCVSVPGWTVAEPTMKSIAIANIYPRRRRRGFASRQSDSPYSCGLFYAVVTTATRLQSYHFHATHFRSTEVARSHSSSCNHCISV